MLESKNQSRQIFLFSIMIASMLIMIILYRAIAILLADSGPEGADDAVNVAILTSDQVTDQSWGSLAYRGQLKIEELYPISAELHSELTTEELKEQKVQEVLSGYADVLIGHGREFSEVFSQAAPENEDVAFVTIHGTAEHSNQSVYTFDKGDIEYFAALAAVIKSETNEIGIIDAIDEREQYPQFEEGMAYYEPESTLHYKVVNSRDDGAKAIELMEELLEQDVDVIYSRGNAFNQYVIDRAKQEDVYVIGYLDDQSYMARDLILTSVINDVSNAYVAIMEDYFSEEGIQPGVNVLNDEDGVYKLAPFGPMFSDEEKEYIAAQIEKFYSGELTF